jgi:hypothetical protein
LVSFKPRLFYFQSKKSIYSIEYEPGWISEADGVGFMEKRNSFVLSGHSAAMKFSEKHQQCSSYLGFYSSAHEVFVLKVIPQRF